MSDEVKIYGGESELDFNQKIRHDVVVSLTHKEDGTYQIPHDKDSLHLLSQFLKDGDSTILKRSRLGLDTQIAEDNNILAAQLIAKITEEDTLRRTDAPAATKSNHRPALDESKLPTVNMPETILEPVGKEVDLDAIAKLGRAHFKGIVDEEGA